MPVAKTDAEMKANMRDILDSRRAPGTIIRNVEAFQSPIDQRIIRNAQDLDKHNKENDVIDAREWGNDQFCDLDAKRRREEFYLGTSQDGKRARVETIKESIQKLEAGYKPSVGEQDG